MKRLVLLVEGDGDVQAVPSLVGRLLNQLPGLKPGVTLPTAPEEHPRDAKGWLHENLAEGYNPTERQLELTRAVTDWAPVRLLNCFQRLEHALMELAAAVVSDRHIASPQRPTN